MPAFSGRRAWVTGASSGIGTASAMALASAEVVMSARRDERIEGLALKIGTAGEDIADINLHVGMCELLIRPQSQEL